MPQDFLQKGKTIPGQVLNLPKGLVSLTSRQSAHEGSKVVSPMHRSPLPPGNMIKIIIT
jgi:hypothetical protein